MFSPERPSGIEAAMPDLEYYKQQSLQALAEQLSAACYDGYPARANRLFLPAPEYDETGRIILPADGPWHVDQHPNKPTGTPPLPDVSSFPPGTRFDSFNRPIHPWIEDMLTNPDIGVVTGTAYFRKWCENATVDPVVFRHDFAEPHLLLIERGDTHRLALPGGFWDPDETASEGAKREAREESGVDIDCFTHEAKPICRVPVGDIRLSAHAWPVTTAVRFDLPLESKAERKQLAEMMARNNWALSLRTLGRFAFKEQIGRRPWKGSDDADKALWVPVSKINQHLTGSHLALAEMAIQL